MVEPTDDANTVSDDTVVCIDDDLQPQPIAPRIRRRLKPNSGYKHWGPCTCWLVVSDTGGYVCVGLTYFFLLYAYYTVVTILIHDTPYDQVLRRVFELILGIGIISHIRAMLTDPGSIELDPRWTPDAISIKEPIVRDGQVVTTCTKCRSFRPDRAHHCSACGRCIRLMDHHCPWINNCVGEDNRKYFILFTAYITFASFFAMGLMLRHFLTCLKVPHRRHRHSRNPYTSNLPEDPACKETERPGPVIMLSFLGMESFFFIVFPGIMFYEQMVSVFQDSTAIEALKQENWRVRSRSGWSNCKYIFGRVSPLWILPTKPRLPRRTTTNLI